jgi:hypothetical protein
MMAVVDHEGTKVPMATMEIYEAVCRPRGILAYSRVLEIRSDVPLITIELRAQSSVPPPWETVKP